MVNAGAEDNLGAGFTETLLDGIDEVVEIGGRWEDYLHDLGVVTGDAVALDDVRNTLDVRVELLLLVGLQLDLNEGLDMEADLLHVDAGMVASDDAGLLQLRDPCRNRGGGDEAGLRELLERGPGVGLQQVNNFPIDFIHK